MRHWRRPGRISLGVAVLVCLGSFNLAWGEESFPLGPGDRLSVTVFRRPDLSGEFRVLPGGALSLPFIGTLPVAGQSVEQVRQALAQRLRDEASLLDPRVSVEIAELQPVLVAGDVRRPGQMPFTLGMTVGHALAAAGGMRRFDLEEAGPRIEIMRMRERLRHGQDGYGVALVRRARLQAEAAGAEDFEPPAEASRYLTPERLRQATESERDIMRRRTASFVSMLAMLTTQTAAYNDEIQALREQSASKDQEAVLIEQEREYVAGLMRQGLTARDSRVVQLARAVVQLDGDRRQITAYIARARQEIARIEQTRSNAETQRQLEISSNLKEIEDTMALLRVTLDEARAGLAELREVLPGDDGPLGPRGGTTFSILRVRASPPQRIAATIDTPLLPGDLVEVSTEATGSGRRLAAGSGN